jgi:hypothetical protein
VDYDPWVSLITGNITTNTTWTASSTYVIDGEVTVNAGVTLTIKEAVIVKFKNATSRLIVDGVVTADSAASSSRIYFTSYKDDTVGGDTNGDGGATSPSAGDWDTIKVNSSATTTLNFSVVRYGGYTGSGGSSVCVWNNGGILYILNSEIATTSNHGIYTLSGSTVIIAADIHGNDYGVYRAGGYLSIGSSNIHFNSSYGVYNALGGDNIHAEYNYWGASDGPYHPLWNPFGSGDYVSGDVDFAPYLTQLHYIYAYDGEIVSAVSSKAIQWNWYNSTSTYKDAWYAGMSTWNTYGNSVGGVSISTSTGATSSADLLVLDIASSSSDYFLGQYAPDLSGPDLLRFNPYHMNQATTSVKQFTATHELGHALGLFHSYLENIMNSYATSTVQTSLGTQDTSDYDYLNANYW